MTLCGRHHLLCHRSSRCPQLFRAFLPAAAVPSSVHGQSGVGGANKHNSSRSFKEQDTQTRKIAIPFKHACAGMDKETAQKEYIALVKSLAEKYAK